RSRPPPAPAPPPTRRSSDLRSSAPPRSGGSLPRSLGGGRLFGHLAVRGRTRASRGTQPGPDRRCNARKVGGGVDRCADRAKASADRKSTRLNSSHQIISYAV